MLVAIVIVVAILFVIFFMKTRGDNQQIMKTKGDNQQTLKEALADKLPEKYTPKKEDSLFVTFYSNLMKQTYANFKLDGFEYLYMFILLEYIKNDELDSETLTAFYQSNRLYDFNNFNIKADCKKLFSHEEGVANRVFLFNLLQPYLKHRKKLININISDIDTLYKENQQLFQKAKAVHDDSIKRNLTELISKSTAVMDVLEFENKVFSYAKDILHPQPYSAIDINNSHQENV